LQLRERAPGQFRFSRANELYADPRLAQPSKRVAGREIDIEALAQQSVDASDRPAVAGDARLARRPTQ
jgi:hypothetical protein